MSFFIVKDESRLKFPPLPEGVRKKKAARPDAHPAARVVAPRAQTPFRMPS
jgi:hypothetical protein